MRLAREKLFHMRIDHGGERYSVAGIRLSKYETVTCMFIISLGKSQISAIEIHRNLATLPLSRELKLPPETENQPVYWASW
jgi:hypothetical protein